MAGRPATQARCTRRSIRTAHTRGGAPDNACCSSGTDGICVMSITSSLAGGLIEL